MLTVKELMSSHLYTLKPTDTIYQARQLMFNKRIRHVPIVDAHGKFVGLVTKHDVLTLSVSELADISITERNEIDDSIPLSKVMITDVVVAETDTDLLDAAHFLVDQKHGCLPIFENDKLVGILTEADFVKLAIHLMERLALREQATRITK